MSVDVRPVELTMPDGVVLRGQQWGDGPDWVILFHDVGEERDLDDWRPLLPAILTSERTLLTVDLAGHGASDGDPDPDRLANDLDSILDSAKERSAEWIAVAGAGVSATQLLKKSAVRPIDALILLSPQMTVEEARQSRGQGESKLFAVGSRSDSFSAAIRQARSASIGWAMLVSLPTEQQGTDLLAGPYASQLVERIVPFVAEQRMLSRTRFIRPTPPD
jgi:pimeloyl-ACP methyl ester carboxylesterase